MSNPRALRRLTDPELEQLCAAELGVLVLTRMVSGHCDVYQADIERLLAQGGFEGIPVGKIVVDAPSAPRFQRENPWIETITDLPCTVLYRHGKPVDRFTTFRVSHLLERIGALSAAPPTVRDQ